MSLLRLPVQLPVQQPVRPHLPGRACFPPGMKKGPQQCAGPYFSMCRNIPAVSLR